jgi:hypothetical protein
MIFANVGSLLAGEGRTQLLTVLRSHFPALLPLFIAAQTQIPASF